MIDSSIFQGKKAAYYTLGCKLNFSETSTFGKLLEEMGVSQAAAGEQADICLINTCSVTEVADHKCRQIIHRMTRNHPGALVVVTGCYAQLESERVSQIEGVDLVLGSNEKASLISFLSDAFVRKNSLEHPLEALHEHHSVKTKDIRSFQPSCSKGNRTRYFLKVQDGCDYFCTYCTIPYARGFSRNPSVSSLVETTGEDFTALVKALDQVEPISRYRISSIEPDLLSDELIDYCSRSRAFMPHFHIPLQSGSDEVLRLMHRRYDKQLFAHKIELIKQKMPDAFIGVDVMVGCRGERPELFEECYDFLDSLDVTQLHVFPYSERPGTAALRIPYIVDEKEKKARCRKLIALSQTKTEAFYARHIGCEMEVLLEKAPRGKAMHGFTRNYIRTEIAAREARQEYDNTLVKLRLTGFNHDKSALVATFAEQ